MRHRKQQGLLAGRMTHVVLVGWIYSWPTRLSPSLCTYTANMWSIVRTEPHWSAITYLQRCLQVGSKILEIYFYLLENLSTYAYIYFRLLSAIHNIITRTAVNILYTCIYATMKSLICSLTLCILCHTFSFRFIVEWNMETTEWKFIHWQSPSDHSWSAWLVVPSHCCTVPLSLTELPCTAGLRLWGALSPKYVVEPHYTYSIQYNKPSVMQPSYRNLNKTLC